MSYAPALAHIIDGIHIANMAVLKHQDVLREQKIDGVLQAFEFMELLVYREPGVLSPTPDPEYSKLFDTMQADFVVQNCMVGTSRYIEPARFECAVQFLRQRRTEGHRSVIISREGTCRAPIYAIAYMLQESRLSLPDAFARIKAQRTRIGLSFNPQSWQSLFKHYGQPYTMDDLWRWWGSGQ